MTPAKTSIFLFAAYPLWSETFIRQDLAFLAETDGQTFVGAALFPGDCICQDGWPDVAVLAPGKPPSAVLARKNGGWKAWLRQCLPRAAAARLSLFRHRRLCDALETFARRHGATHIHAEFADLGALIAACAARRLGITYSVGIHAFDIHVCKYDISSLLGNARFVTVCNHAAMDACRKRLPNLADRLHLIYHGVNLSFWTFSERRSCGTDRLQVLFIGRLVPKKGIPVLLEALKRLQDDNLPFSLSVAGDGPQAQLVKQQAENLGISDCVRWLGRQTPEQLRSLMPAMTCLCAPSIITPDGDRDGIPNVILEAMACGLPVVASQVGSIAEAVTEQTGWPVNDLTPESLAAALRHCFLSQPLQENRRRAARKRIEERFDARKLAIQRAELFAKA